jgi:ankyrin repeat protein
MCASLLRRACVLTAVAASVLAAAPAAAQSVMADAAKRHDVAAVRQLIGRADVNAAGGDGMTALHWAVHHDDAALIDSLLTAGANVGALNRYGVAPLAIAALNGNAAIVQRLLRAGADPNVKQPEGETALMTASRSGSLESVRALLDHQADVNARDKWRQQTALMWAAAEGHADVVRELLARGADLAARSKEATSGRRAPRPAASGMPQGFSAIQFAVRHGHREAARLLLDAGASVDDRTAAGNNLLHLAIMNAHYELAALLLERGADPNRPSSERLTPLHHVVHTRRPPWQTLPPPVPSGGLDSLELMKRLIAKGADVNARLTPSDRRRSPDDETIPPPDGGTTPLWLAATGPDPDAMRLLLDAGADPSIRTDANETTLLAAAGIAYRQGYRQKLEPDVLEAVRILLERGADVNATDNMGNTALHAAAIRGVNSVVVLLLDKGASLNARNKNGKLPVQLAEDASDARSQPETAALLRRLMAERASGRQ